VAEQAVPRSGAGQAPLAPAPAWPRVPARRPLRRSSQVPLHSFSFLSSGATVDLGAGAVARQVA
jgi:hypothetical protein